MSIITYSDQYNWYFTRTYSIIYQHRHKSYNYYFDHILHISVCVGCVSGGVWGVCEMCMCVWGWGVCVCVCVCGGGWGGSVWGRCEYCIHFNSSFSRLFLATSELLNDSIDLKKNKLKAINWGAPYIKW